MDHIKTKIAEQLAAGVSLRERIELISLILGQPIRHFTNQSAETSDTEWPYDHRDDLEVEQRVCLDIISRLHDYYEVPFFAQSAPFLDPNLSPFEETVAPMFSKDSNIVKAAVGKETWFQGLRTCDPNPLTVAIQEHRIDCFDVLMDGVDTWDTDYDNVRKATTDIIYHIYISDLHDVLKHHCLRRVLQKGCPVSALAIFKIIQWGDLEGLKIITPYIGEQDYLNHALRWYVNVDENERWHQECVQYACDMTSNSSDIVKRYLEGDIKNPAIRANLELLTF